nr:type II secretion system F family protein [Streptomyces roseifaciens]
MAWPPGASGRELRRARLMFAGGGSLVPPAPWPPALVGEWGTRLRRWARARRELACLPLGGAVALLGRSVLPLLAALVAVPLVRRWLAVRKEQRERERREAAVIELCGTVAGELRAGRQPGQALAGVPAGDLGPQWTAVSAAARFGGDVPGALRAVAACPGAEGLHGVAACWRVAVDGGAGLAAGLERVSAALSAERDQREELRSQLAGARSTAVMLALLPVLALLMGSALGAAPLRVLLHTPAGLGCLLLGGLLEAAGIAWTGRIVRAAAGERGGAGGPGPAEGKVS